MSYRSMLRLAGLAAMVGGTILTLATVQQFLNLASPGLLNSDGSSNVSNAVLISRFALQPFGEILVALGLVGLYARQARATGILGLSGFLLAFFSTVLVEALYLAVLPAYLGYALFGVSSLKARVYPRVASILLIAGALVGQLFNPTVAVGPGAAFGYIGAVGTMVVTIVIAWFGFILFRERVEEEARPLTQMSPNLLRLTGLMAVLGGVLGGLINLEQLIKLSFPDPGQIPYETSNVTITVLYYQQISSYIGLAAVALGLVGLYVRQLEVTARTQAVEILMPISFLLAFGGTLWSLQLEETHYVAVLLGGVGWILFGVLSLQLGVYPRRALLLLIVSSFVVTLLSPIVVYHLVNLLGGILGEDAVGNPSYYLYMGEDGGPLVFLRVIAAILFYVAIDWLGLFLTSEQRSARAEQQQPERVGDTRTFRGLGAAVLIIGLLPVVLLLILPGFREQSGLSGAQASVSDDSNLSCPPENQALEGVWGGSNRLILHDPCRRIVATVVDVEGPNQDGDMDIWLSPDPGYTALTGTTQNVENSRRFRFGGSFSVEFLPRDGSTTDPITGEEGPPHLPLPREGDKVDLWGAYVFDSGHGYYEIHPIFSEHISSDGGNTWEGHYTSGPQYGGSPKISTSATQWQLCRNENNDPCLGYDGDETL